MSLIQKHCLPCEGGTPPLSHEEAIRLLAELKNSWELVKGNPSSPADDLGTRPKEKLGLGFGARIKREFKFSASGGKNPFLAAIDFVNQVAKLSESEGHHPDMHIFYNKVIIELTTHAVKGLSENDFILAAKIDNILSNPL